MSWSRVGRLVRHDRAVHARRAPPRRRARAASPARHAPTTRGGGSEVRPRSGRRCEGRSATTARPQVPAVPTAPETGATGRGARPDEHPRPPGRRGSWPEAWSARTATAGSAGPGARAPPRSRRQASTRRSAGLCSPDALPEEAPQLELPLRLVELGRPGRPALEHVGTVDGVAVEEVCDVPDAREAPRAFHGCRVRCMCCASGASHGSSKCSSTTSMSGHTARSGTQGSPFGSAPAAHANAPPTNVPGKGKAMLAHTPSCLPSRAPRCMDRRWVSHRSMPRVGTETTSGVIGSSSGSATSRASSDTRASARSDRWTWSISAEYVAAVLGPD